MYSAPRQGWKAVLAGLVSLMMLFVLLPTIAMGDSVSGVKYYDPVNETTPTANNVTVLTKTDTTWNTGWYYVISNDTVIINSSVTVNGDVNLILGDGCNLTVEDGIGVDQGDSLTIYSASENGTGALSATGTTEWYSGIGNHGQFDTGGTVVINGGNITATAASWGAGIGGSEMKITINGGTVTATGGSQAAGIGGTSDTKENNSININGGTVKAYGGDGGSGGAGIGSSGANAGTASSITITGGSIFAYGGDGFNSGGPGIGCRDNTTDCTISITGATIVAKGGNATDINKMMSGGPGIGSKSSTVINSSTVTATGGDGYPSGNGIYGQLTANSNNLLVVTGGKGADPLNKQFSANIDGFICEGTTLHVYGEHALTQEVLDNYNKELDPSHVSGIVVEENATLTVSDDVVLELDGEVTVSSNGKLVNNGTLTTKGSLTNKGTITNGGTITNSGTALNEGTIENNGTFTNAEGATLTNTESGTLKNSSTFTNYGTTINEGALENSGTITNTENGVLTNHKAFTNTGTVVNDGEIDNDGMINSTSSFQNNGTIYSSGSITGDITGEGVKPGACLVVEDIDMTSSYGTPSSENINIQNEGFETATITGITVSGSDFEIITGKDTAVLGRGTNTSWSIQPRAGLGAGTRTATITVTATYKSATGTKTTTATATITCTVSNAPASKPSARVITPPAALDLTENGFYQALVRPGTAEGGTMQYSLSQSGPYSTTIPSASAAGTYTVWYKVVGDADHEDTDPESVTVIIKEGEKTADPEPSAPEYDVTVPEEVEGASVTVEPKDAAAGTTVTLTVKVEDGYHLDTLTVTGKDEKAIELKVNEDGTYTFVMPDGTVSVSCTCMACTTLVFPDLDPTAWYHEHTDYVISHGLMQGTPDGLFVPEGTVTRAQMVTLLWNLKGKPVVNYYMTYPDVDQEAWYAEAVRWATSEQVVNGYGDGTFGPNDLITREQMATMLYNYEKKYGDGGFQGDWMYRLPFEDLDQISDWSFEAVAWCNMKGVITGKENDIFDPKGQATRVEMAAILTQYLTIDESTEAVN